jgi:hypothetical protein
MRLQWSRRSTKPTGARPEWPHLDELGAVVEQAPQPLVVNPLEHQAARSSAARIQASGGVLSSPSSVL